MCAQARRAAAAPSGRPGPCGGESGQALVLSVLMLGLLLVVMGGAVGLASGYAFRAGAASAADAAALACAAQATVTEQVDARGVVYGRQVAVDAEAGPDAAAAAWGDNLAFLPGLRTTAFAASPAGDDCSVTAAVEAPGGLLSLLGRPHAAWQVTAEARAGAAAD